MVPSKAKKTTTFQSPPSIEFDDSLSPELKKSKEKQAAQPEAPENSKQRKGRQNAKSAKPAAQTEDKPKPVRQSSSNINITALVVPPFAIKKSLMNSIKETYHVIEQAQLDVSEVEEAL